MNKKILKTYNVKNFEILTDEGFKDIISIHKTIKYYKWKLKTQTQELNCADNHIVFCENYIQKYIKDLDYNDKIFTKNGLESIIELYKTNIKINMYDAEINSIDHRYYTNNILSHNTTCSRILSKNYNTKYIDATTDGKVNTIESIDKFCSTISLEGGKDKLKCVVLEELGGASEEFMERCLPLIERHSKNARFIGSINYINKLPEPLLSRFNCISFEPINNEEENYLIEEYKKRIGSILNAAKITYTQEILDKFVRNKFPDMRQMLNLLQSFYIRGIKELNDQNFNINYDFVDLFNICISKPNPVENYKFIVSEYSSKINDALSTLGTNFIDFLKQNKPDKIDKIPMIIITIAEYQSQLDHVIDKLISLLACVYKLQIIINS